MIILQHFHYNEIHDDMSKNDKVHYTQSYKIFIKCKNFQGFMSFMRNVQLLYLEKKQFCQFNENHN